MATETEELDAIFSALASSTRRSLITQLGEGDATVSELAKPFDMTLAAVSKHLSVLENPGLVRRTRQGKARQCSLQEGVLDSAESWLASRRCTGRRRYPPSPTTWRARNRNPLGSHTDNRKRHD